MTITPTGFILKMNNPLETCMKNSSLVASALLLAGILLGGVSVYAMMSRNKDSTSSNSVSGIDHGSMSSMNMESMNAQLKGKTSDDFDKAFLAMMTEHHQGAIDMATQAKQNAKHTELKTMADDIISAQTREIEQMKEWRNAWGY